MCIGGFYATSLTWGQHTHYAMVEYWRWWLVHLWVEGFFEVFATAGDRAAVHAPRPAARQHRQYPRS